MRGILTAQGPIHQGGDTEGNVAAVKRMTILGADGRRVEVPAVSGNGLRGALRRVSAKLTLEALEGHDWRYAAFSALVSGGQLTNTQKAWSDAERVELSQAIPHFALFGVAGGLGMSPGQWQCGDAWPVCAETAHLTGVGSALPLRQLTELREGTRVDAKAFSPVFAAEYKADVETGELVLIASDQGDRATDQMIYSTEAILPGVMFAWDVHVLPEWASAGPWLARVLRAWQAGGGFVGGMSARGYGSTVLSGELAEWVAAQPEPRKIDVVRASAALEIVT